MTFANLRGGFPPHLHFVSEAQAREYSGTVEFARAMQGSRWCVAPRCTVTACDGRVLPAGARVTRKDFALIQVEGRSGQRTLIPVWQQIERAVREGTILEREDLPEEPPQSGPPEAA